MGHTGIKFACAHSGATGPELSGDTVGYRRKSEQAKYCVRSAPLLWCLRSVVFLFLFFAEFSGGLLLYLRSKRHW